MSEKTITVCDVCGSSGAKPWEKAGRVTIHGKSLPTATYVASVQYRDFCGACRKELEEAHR